MSDEKWNECDGVGTIKKYDTTPQARDKPIENYDDYDERKKHGGRFCVVHSRLERQEM